MIAHWSALLVVLGTLSLGPAVQGVVEEPLTQQDVDYIAESLVVQFLVKENVRGQSSVAIDIKNNGTKPISKGGWGIYFCVFSYMQAAMFGSAVSPFYLAHIHGCVYSVQPATYFTSLEPERTNRIDMFSTTLKFVCLTDVLPNWYIGPQKRQADDSLQPRLLAQTKDVRNFVAPFTRPSQWKGGPDDPNNPLTPEDRFALYTQARGAASPSSLPLLPPVSHQHVEGETEVQLTTRWRVRSAEAPECGEVAFLLAVAIGLQQDDACTKDCIVFGKTEESLRVDPQPGLVTIGCTTGESGFQSAMTLLAYWERGGSIPHSVITDSPRFDYRGFMVDISRRFRSLDSLKRLVRIMARYKLNKLHLHLADDEGWRLEIDGLQELTEIGATKCFDLTGTQCLFPVYGQTPDRQTEFLTKKEYINLVQYASRWYVEIIPEIDTPGHSQAAIAAMEWRQKRILASGGSVDEASSYLLTEERDHSSYRSVQGYMHNVLCPCIPSTYRFLRHVIATVQTYHHTAGHPLTFIHLGGDEVPAGSWQGSPACSKLLREHAEPYIEVRHAVMKYYVMEVSRLTAKLGVGMAMWQDGLMAHTGPTARPYPREQLNNPTVVAFVWQSDFGMGEAQNPILLANAGYKVVQVPATHLYLDHAYEADPEERGLHWATRAISTNRSFSFTPDDIYKSVVGGAGEIIPKARLCRGQCPAYTKEGRKNLWGIEGALWGELIHSEDLLDFMTFPRLLAVAERAWHKAQWEDEADWAQLERDFSRFANVLGHHELPRLTRLGIKYRISPPGVNWMPTHQLYTATEFPNQQVVVSLDEGSTWQPIRNPHYLTQASAMFATRSPDMRLSRPITVRHIVCEGSCLPYASLVVVLFLLSLKLFWDQ